MKNKTVHEGHRQRLLSRFREEGLDNFDERHVLELLLFFAIPRVDTAELAQALLDHFGSVVQVFEATAEELQVVQGIGPNTAALLTLVTSLCRYYLVKRADAPKPRIFNNIEKCGDYLLPRFCGLTKETVFMLCLDAKCKLLCCCKVGEGSINSASIPTRKIVETALNSHASSVVLAHNHPSGLAFPSDEDVRSTVEMARVLHAVEVSLVDHIIVADNDYISLAQSGYYALNQVIGIEA